MTFWNANLNLDVFRSFLDKIVDRDNIFNKDSRYEIYGLEFFDFFFMTFFDIKIQINGQDKILTFESKDRFYVFYILAIEIVNNFSEITEISLGKSSLRNLSFDETLQLLKTGGELKISYENYQSPHNYVYVFQSPWKHDSYYFYKEIKNWR